MIVTVMIVVVMTVTTVVVMIEVEIWGRDWNSIIITTAIKDNICKLSLTTKIFFLSVYLTGRIFIGHSLDDTNDSRSKKS